MKYRKKPVIIDAEPYHEGLEDGWKVYFSGNGDTYERSFTKKQDADYFIKNDIGLSYVNDDDRNYGNLIYETPVPIIKLLKDTWILNILIILLQELGVRDIHVRKLSLKKHMNE